jgi:hypothetical protein
MRKTIVRFLLVSFIGTATILTACKKENGKSTEEKIVGKWTPEAIYYDYSFGGTSQKDTTFSVEGDYIQFNSDGTVSTSSEGEEGSGTWSIQDNKLLLKEASEVIAPAYDIQKLTDNELNLHLKQVDGDNYMEMTLHLTK